MSKGLYSRILKLLLERGPLTIEQIADRLDIGYPNAANAVRHLRADPARVHIEKRLWRPGRPKARFAYGPGADDMEVIDKPEAYTAAYANGRTVRQPLGTDWVPRAPEREDETVARVKARGGMTWWGAL